jgi:hypothetical protein
MRKARTSRVCVRPRTQFASTPVDDVYRLCCGSESKGTNRVDQGLRHRDQGCSRIAEWKLDWSIPTVAHALPHPPSQKYLSATRLFTVHASMAIPCDCACTIPNSVLLVPCLFWEIACGFVLPVFFGPRGVSYLPSQLSSDVSR